VDIDVKPKDCDFWRSPVGIKGCHYKRAIDVFDAVAYVGTMSRTVAERIVRPIPIFDTNIFGDIQSGRIHSN
jgi:hypothetical protein